MWIERFSTWQLSSCCAGMQMMSPVWHSKDFLSSICFSFALCIWRLDNPLLLGCDKVWQGFERFCNSLFHAGHLDMPWQHLDIPFHHCCSVSYKMTGWLQQWIEKKWRSLVGPGGILRCLWLDIHAIFSCQPVPIGIPYLLSNCWQNHKQLKWRFHQDRYWHGIFTVDISMIQ